MSQRSASGPAQLSAAAADTLDSRTAVVGPRSREDAKPGWLRRFDGNPWARETAVLLGFLVAGVVATWPRASYLSGTLPYGGDQAQYVWSLWWVEHQITHLGNPWFTSFMAAPVGVALGYDTLMPLVGVLMAPVTMAFGPSASFNLLAIVTPGLAAYALYRAARLWLPSLVGAIAAGASFGLSAMLTWQDWYHLNIAVGCVFLPLVLEAAVRLRRRPGVRAGLVLGLVLGASVLVNQEPRCCRSCWPPRRWAGG